MKNKITEFFKKIYLSGFVAKIKNFLINHKIWSAIIIIGLLFVVFFSYSKFSTSNSVIQYTFGKVARGDLVVSVDGSGQVSTLSKVSIKPNTTGQTQTLGQIISVKVKNGDTVKAGQVVAVLDGKNALQTLNQATDILLERHKITDPTKADFSTMNQSDMLETASSITATMTYLLAAIAGISLLVGGIGIMNMMLTTVTERTREIGLRKAIGAKRKDIQLQFLVESMMLTIIGGIIGILVGIGIAWAVTLTGLLTAKISLFSIILSFGVSALIGIIFGYYPAARASTLNPIDALRYE